MSKVNPEGHTVIILVGDHAGEEGICLGPATGQPGLWAVSPNSSNAILALEFEKEFGILLNSGQAPGRN